MLLLFKQSTIILQPLKGKPNQKKLRYNSNDVHSLDFNDMLVIIPDLIYESLMPLNTAVGEAASGIYYSCWCRLDV